MNDTTLTLLLFSGESKDVELEELNSLTLKELEDVDMMYETVWEDECNYSTTPVSLLDTLEHCPKTRNTLLNSLKTKNRVKELTLSTMLRDMGSWDKTLVKELKPMLMEALKLL